mmetsp:Transcript_12066/g.37165  ORF Transcript_12066/g.37165 Transcript_12066/m.37165 type:complete len:258 (+) Transcript_12066:167-940(+)
MSEATVLLPVVATVGSLAVPCILGLLAALDESYEGPPSLPALFKFLGPCCLFTGHAILTARKPAAARGDKTYLASAVLLCALFGGGCLKAMGHITAGPPVALAGACGLLFGVTFADLASSASRKTRLVVRLAISCGCCGSSCLIAVGATGGWAAAALGASVAFSVANSAVFVSMHGGPLGARVGQALKVMGSLCLLSGNAIGLGLHSEPPAGVVGGAVADALYGAGALNQAVVVACGLAVGYGAAVVAASEKKTKTA